MPWRNDRDLVLQCLERARAKRGSMRVAIPHSDADVRACHHDYVARVYEMGDDSLYGLRRRVRKRACRIDQKDNEVQAHEFI